MNASTNLSERVYSVLVVSATEKINQALGELMPEARYSPVHCVKSVSEARRALSERAYDQVIVSSPLPDENGLRFAIDVSLSKSAVALLLLPAAVFDELSDRASEYGVFTLSKPTSRPLLALALSWLSAAGQRLKRLEQKTLSVEEKMEEIRLVNRAKWLLIKELGMDEAQAHRRIEQQAMDQCVSKKEIAQEIIKAYTVI